MQRCQSNFIVLTGGPGSGKTSLINDLARHGFEVSTEAGRAIIQHHQAVDGPALPWRDPGLFAELMLSWEMRSFDVAAEKPGIVFFDRGVPDILGYVQLSGIQVPLHVQEATRCFRYNPSVFILPPWPEIFTQDRERKQTLDEAEQTFHAMITAYGDCGYEIIEVPRLPVPERTSFILGRLDTIC